MTDNAEMGPGLIGSDTAQEPIILDDLTGAVRTAKRGFRGDVQVLAAALPSGAMHIPLAASITDMPVGEDLKPEEEVTLKPHLLPDEDGAFFVALFTDADVLKSVGQYLGWTTDETNELQFCTLAAPMALDLAMQLMDGEQVLGTVINPSHEDELILQGHEVGALSQGQAVPLVGYVQQIPLGADEEVLISELESPPSEELLAALQTIVSELSGVSGYSLQQTFNAERDREPHPTLTLQVADPASLDVEALNERLATELEGKLPDPGYIDVLFDTGDAKAD